jgi:hypothetical protein
MNELGGSRSTYEVVDRYKHWRTDGKIPLGRRRGRWENNIKIGIRMEWGGVG